MDSAVLQKSLSLQCNPAMGLVVPEQCGSQHGTAPAVHQ